MIGKLSISNLPSVYFDGYYRVLGCIKSTPESIAKFPVFGVHNMVGLDPSLWQEIDLSWNKPTILNQKQTSSCVGHGAVSAMEVCWLQSGRPLKNFSPFFTYGLINGGRDAGAQISDSMTALMSYGACPIELNPNLRMFKNQFSQNMYDAAKRFKLIKAYHCPNWESICSAISLGFVCPLGIQVGDNFGQLDSEGVAPLPGWGGGGHCILGVGLKKSSRYGWLIKIQNSWGLNWGLGGYAYLRKEHIDNYPDAFAVQSVMDDPQDTNSPTNIPVVS